MKLLFLLVFLCAATGSAMAQTARPAQAAQEGWIADSKTGCKVWDPMPQQNETVSWSGSCKNGLAQGRGVLQWYADGKPTGDTYQACRGCHLPLAQKDFVQRYDEYFEKRAR